MQYLIHMGINVCDCQIHHECAEKKTNVCSKQAAEKLIKKLEVRRNENRLDCAVLFSRNSSVSERTGID